MTRLDIKTSMHKEFIDITSKVEGVVAKSGITDGIVCVFSPHTTAGVTINENADPDVTRDITMKTTKIIDSTDSEYRHGEGNSDGHIKSSLFGASETVIISGGRLLLGTWQAIYFAEFDGPRTRHVNIKVISG